MPDDGMAPTPNQNISVQQINIPFNFKSNNKLHKVTTDRRMTHDIVRNEPKESGDIFDDLET